MQSDVLSGSAQVVGRQERWVGRTVLVLVGQAFEAVLGLTIRLMVVRALGAHGFGLLSLGVAAQSLVTKLGGLGLPVGIAHYTAKLSVTGGGGAARRVLGAAARVGLPAITVATVAGIMASPLLGRLYGEPGVVRVLRILLVGAPCTVAVAFVLGGFRGLGRVRELVAFQSIGAGALRLMVLLPLLGLLGPRADAATVAWGYTVAAGLSALAVLGYSAVTLPGAAADSSLQPSELARFSLPALATGFLNTLESRLVPLLLGAFAGASTVGLFVLALTLSQLLVYPLQAAGYLVLPQASRYLADGRQPEFCRYFTSVSAKVAMVTFPAFLGLFAFARPLLSLFGEDFVPGTTSLRILLMGYFVHVLAGPNGMALTAAGRPQLVLRSSIVGFSTGIGLFFILVNPLGPLAAAIGVVTNFLILNLLVGYYLRKHTGALPFHSGYL